MPSRLLLIAYIIIALCVAQAVRVCSTQTWGMHALVAQVFEMQTHSVHNNCFPHQYNNLYLDTRGYNNLFSSVGVDIYFWTIEPENILKYYFPTPGM